MLGTLEVDLLKHNITSGYTTITNVYIIALLSDAATRGPLYVPRYSTGVVQTADTGGEGIMLYV